MGHNTGKIVSTKIKIPLYVIQLSLSIFIIVGLGLLLMPGRKILVASQQTSKPELFLRSESPLPATIGKDITITAWLATNNAAIGGYDLIIHFNPQQLQMKSLQTNRSEICPQIKWIVAQTSITEANVNGIINLSAVIYDQQNLAAIPTAIPMSTVCMLGSFGFTPLTATTDAQITYEFAGDGVSKTDTQVVSYPDSADVLGSVSNLSVNIQSTGSASLRIDPPFSSMAIGESKELSIMLDTAGKEVVGADSILHYDPAYLQVQTLTPGSLFGDNPVQTIDPAQGIVTLLSNIQGLTPVNGTNILIGKLQVKALSRPASGSALLAFDFASGNRNDSNVAEAGSDADILSAVNNSELQILPELAVTATPSPTAMVTPVHAPSPTALPTDIPPTETPMPTVTSTPASPATPTVTPTTPTPNPTVTMTPVPSISPTPLVSLTPTPTPKAITLTLRLAGRDYPNSPKTAKVQLLVYDANSILVKSYQFIDQTYRILDTKGSLTISDLLPGQYHFAIKPLGYNQVIITRTINPDYSFDGNFTAVRIPAGDVDMNGIVDSVDYAKLRIHFKSQSIIAEADYDGSGEINVLDYKNYYESIRKEDCVIEQVASCGQ